MSASRQKKQRQADSGILTEKEKQAAREAAQKKRKRVLYSIFGVIAVLAAAALLVWDNGVIQRNLTAYQVGSHKYTAADVDYYFYTEYNSYNTSYGSYLFESGVSLKKQVATTDEDGNDVTWYDMFRENAINSLTSTSVLYDEAIAAGYTLSEDGQASVDSTLESIKSTCETYGISESYYLKQTYGPYMTMKKLTQILEQGTLAQEYYTDVYNGYADSYDDSTLQTYYDEHTSDLDTYYYELYYVSGAAETTTDEDGNTVEATEEETAAAMAAAEEKANQLVELLSDSDQDGVDALVEEDDDVSSMGSRATIGSSLSDTYSSWLLDSARKEGDAGMVESSSGYYVLHYQKHELDEYKPATYRDITITAEKDEDADAPTEEQTAAAKAKAEEILAAATDEQAFIDQVADNSSSSTASNEGLNQSVLKTSLTENDLIAWLYDEERKEGDTALMELDDGTGYQIFYFCSYDDEPYWKQTARTALANDAYTEWFNSVKANYTTATGSGYGLIGEDAGK